MIEVSFKSHLFRRKSIRRKLSIDGINSQDCIKVKLNHRPGTQSEILRILGRNIPISSTRCNDEEVCLESFSRSISLEPCESSFERSESNYSASSDVTSPSTQGRKKAKWKKQQKKKYAPLTMASSKAASTTSVPGHNAWLSGINPLTGQASGLARGVVERSESIPFPYENVSPNEPSTFPSLAATISRIEKSPFKQVERVAGRGKS